MSVFKDKSLFNIKAADLLLKNAYFAPSVHCSYYSCVQFILHILFDKQQKDPVEFESEKRGRKDGTHGHAIFLMGLQLIKKDYQSYKTFQRLIPELKKLREQSDYKPILINHEMGYDALRKAETINNLLVKI